MTVLLADDDEDQLAVRGMLLRHNGFETIEAADAPTALRMIETQELACALIDLCLPSEQDGLGLIRQLKQRYPSLPVFVLTGRTVNSKSYPELRSVDGFLIKGASVREILSRLRNLG